MKEISKPWHMEVLNLHNQYLFNNLIYEHNLITSVLKEIEIDFQGEPRIGRGYFAVKDKVQYFIEEKIAKDLPIRIGEEVDKGIYKSETVVSWPRSISKFKIIPEHKIPFRNLVDSFAPFEHTNQLHWLLMKLISIAAFISRTYICVSSESAFGKSSVFELLHGITDKCPVFKPRTVPGLLKEITGVGNMVFDEVHECRGETKEIMEDISLQLGGGKPTYINGALPSSKTKAVYHCPNQSITYLYNNKDHYTTPDKEYFDYMFKNNKAIDNRFLKLKLFGKLLEKFDKEFNLPKLAEANRSLYIDFAKELAYLQELVQKSGYNRKYGPSKPILSLEGRRRNIFDDITLIMDMYSEDQKEYDELYNSLEKSVVSYREMLGKETHLLVEEEEVV